MINETSDACESSNDWPDGTYSANVSVGGVSTDTLSWQVHHELQNALGVAALLQTHEAAWAVEYRCAQTMYLGVETTNLNGEREQSPMTGTTKVQIAKKFIGDGTIHLWPGVITVKQCSLDPAGSGWGNSPIHIGAGRWLVRGNPIKVEHTENSPIVFRDDSSMTGGEVSITVNASGKDTRFVVRANPERIEQLSHHQPALLSCWATALAMLPYQDAYKIERDEDDIPHVPNCQLGEGIIARLLEHDENFSLWDDKQTWDPMAAATAFIPLEPPQHEEDDD